MARKARATEVFSNWYYLAENFQTSAKEFYSQVETAVQRRQIPDVKLSRVDWREGGPFSAKREYLRVRRKEFAFDICAAPFGTGFFFSWWLGEIPSGFWALVAAIPVLGLIVERMLGRYTYYKADTALMFQESIRQAVNEVIEQMLSAKGVRALTELEKKPILRQFQQR